MLGREAAPDCATMSDNMISAVLFAAMIVSVYLAGRLAERRGRNFRTWAWIAATIGPFALPLLYLFPKRHDTRGGSA
jgi:MFS family permease